MSVNTETKPLVVQYRCGKCKTEINPEHFFCSECRIQYTIGESS